MATPDKENYKLESAFVRMYVNDYNSFVLDLCGYKFEINLQ